MNIFRFEKLDVWKLSQEFSVDICRLSLKFPQYEIYALGNQMRRAAMSVPSNIAEGTSRFSTREQIHFIEIAYSSLMEVITQLFAARDLNYIEATDTTELLEKAHRIAAMLSSLRKSFLQKLESNKE